MHEAAFDALAGVGIERDAVGAIAPSGPGAAASSSR